MVTEKKLKQIAEHVIKISPATETEVLLFISDSGLTRFANSQIHQSVAWNDLGISVRVVIGKKIGVASVNSLDKKSLQDVVQRAVTLARMQEDDEFYDSLPKPKPIPSLKNEIFKTTEQQRATGVAKVIDKVKGTSIIASGAYQSGNSAIAVANSHGVWAFHETSSCDLSTILIGSTSSGFAAQVGRKDSDINAKDVGSRAVEKVVQSANPVDVEPGKWEVILEPQAVSEMMVFFNWMGPNARLYHEQASAFSGKLGKKVVGENITIVDDPLDPESSPMPFDFEGFPKKKLEIVKNGVLKNLTYDSYFAHRYKAQNTGHALPAPNTAGPIPLHIYIKPGNRSREAMIKSVKKGLLVTRLWYVRVLSPRQLSITGMTRDGTFLIENGKIVAGVKNLRFNQSIPEALGNVVAIENKLTPIASFEAELGITRLPALHIKDWQFSSGTLF